MSCQLEKSLEEIMCCAKKSLRSFLILFLLRYSISTDTITRDQLLKDGDVLISNGESFALGFFSPQNSKTSRYVGIWFNQIPEQTVVWVANRDNPVSNTSGVLSFDKNGNLVIFDTRKPDDDPLWSTNVSVTAVAKNYSAQLLDSGNFVVFQQHDNLIVWQSFDFPTDTWIPNMKLGVNRKTGLTWFLTSWKSPEDPATGAYSLGFDVDGYVPQLFLNKSSQPYWRGGPWNGVRFSGIFQMSEIFIFNNIYVENQEEVSFMVTRRNSSIFSRMVLNGSAGTVSFLNWQEDQQKWVGFWYAPNDECDYYAHCGPFGDCDPYNVGKLACKCLPGFEPKFVRDGSGGCVRKPGLSVCGNGEGFVKMAGVKVPDTGNARVDKSLGIKDCEKLCLKNCSCAGYTSSADIGKGGNGCLTWYGELTDVREYSGGDQDLYVRVDAQELAQYSKKQKGSHPHAIVMSLILSTSVALLVLSMAFWFSKKKRRGERRRNILSNNFSSNDAEEINERGTSTDVHYYSLSTIIEATQNFSLPNKVGQGGFGSVYKGILENGQEIAVKRLSKSSGQGIEEFRNEVMVIAKLQHRNLVKLLGFCTQQEEKMLIYEYLSNKGLDCFIFDEERKSMLDWRKRFDIILGIARGMVYLHHDSRLRIIHRDLKASNVLLDASMNPKISDFGMARIVSADQVEETTRRVVGTYGYMSPEYAMEGLFSIKSDVFSFGVLTLEIISGRKNNSYYQQNYVINLIGHVWNLWSEGKALEIVDSVLGQSSEQDQEILRCVHIGLLCVQESATARPTMSEVATMLCNETALPAPSHPAFVLRTPNEGLANVSSTSPQAISSNEITMSMVQGR